MPTSNKDLVDRYDALVGRANQRVEASESVQERRGLLHLISRLNTRGLRELERRQDASEEKLWAESLFPNDARSN